MTLGGTEVSFIEYLRALYSKNPPDLIVALGGPASIFVQRYRPQIFPKAPMVFTAVEQRRINVSALTELDTVVAVGHDFPAIIENILQILPDTKNVMVVIGNSPNEKFWLQEMRRELKPFENRIAFTWTSDQSFNEILKHASELPPHSAIYWHGMLVDAAGVVHEGDSTLKRLHATANAPMFSFIDVFFNGEIVGGPMHAMLDGGRETAAVAIRILNGEKPGDIKVPPTKFATPIYDWRQLQRWNISESRLPPGSEVHFREPTIWQQYFWQMVAMSAALALLSCLVLVLIWEDRRRRRSEANTQALTGGGRRHWDRVVTAGPLAASIAHEIRQPLSAIASFGSAGLRWLKHDPPNLDNARSGLENIVTAVHRADDVIKSVTALFKNKSTTRTEVYVNALIEEVLVSTARDRGSNGISLETNLVENPPPYVMADPIQLQQVIIEDLITNAIDAMSASKHEARILLVETNIDQDRFRSDHGCGSVFGFNSKVAEQLFTAVLHDQIQQASALRFVDLQINN